MKRGKSMKRIIGSLMAVVLCTALALFVVDFQAKAEDPIKYESKTKGTETPTMDGYLFAGWYSDAEGTTAVETPTSGETYFAKFVPEEVLGIKAQDSENLFSEENASSAAIRFVTSIDSTNYQKIGFLVKKGDGTENDGKVTNLVYEKLYGISGKDGSVGAELSYTPAETFHAASKYFKTYTVRNIPQTAYNADITITPYWVTMDGTKVFGTKSIRTINYGRSWIYIDTTANSDGDEAGTLNHPYTSLDDAVDAGDPAMTERIIVKSAFALGAKPTWKAHGKSIVFTSDDGTKKPLDLSYAAESLGTMIVAVNDDVTFEDVTLTLPNQFYANGHSLKVDATVNMTNDLTAAKQTTVYGGANKVAVDSTYVELNNSTGTYYLVFGGGCSGGGVVKGDATLNINNANVDRVLGGGSGTPVTGKTFVNLTNVTAREVYGGGTSSSVGETHVVIDGGSVCADASNTGTRFVFGGGLEGDVNGDANLTIKGAFSPNANNSTTDHKSYAVVYGGCRVRDNNYSSKSGTVKGDANIKVEGDAKISYIYGAGNNGKTDVNGTCNITVDGENVHIYGVQGGGANKDAVDDGGKLGGNNGDTHIVLNAGTVHQIFGGNRAGMTGNTLIEINGGEVLRRIYGGCYNAHDEADKSNNYVTGTTMVVINDASAVKLNESNALGGGDNSLCAGSRFITMVGFTSTDSIPEKAYLIFNNGTYESLKTKIGLKNTYIPLTGDVIQAQDYDYLVKVSAGGNVSVSDNVLSAETDDEDAKGIIEYDSNVEAYFTNSGSSELPAATAKHIINVTFDTAAATAGIATAEARIGNMVYPAFTKAIEIASGRGDKPAITLLNDCTISETITLNAATADAPRNEYTILSEDENDPKTITGASDGTFVSGTTGMFVVSGGRLVLKDVILKDGYDAVMIYSGSMALENVQIKDAPNVGVYHKGGTETLTNVTLTNVGKHGISIGSGTVTADNVTLDGINTGTHGQTYHGISMVTSGKLKINEGGLTIKNVEHNGSGIAVSTGENGGILEGSSNLTIDTTAGYGLNISGTGTIQGLSNVTIRNTTRAGILNNGTITELSTLNIENAGTDGITNAGTIASLSGVTIDTTGGNDGDGIRNNGTLTAENVEIKNVSGCGARSDTSADATMTLSATTIDNATKYGLYLTKGAINVSDVTVKNLTAANRHGVYLNGGTLDISNDNTAANGLTVKDITGTGAGGVNVNKGTIKAGAKGINVNNVKADGVYLNTNAVATDLSDITVQAAGTIGVNVIGTATLSEVTVSNATGTNGVGIAVAGTANVTGAEVSGTAKQGILIVSGGSAEMSDVTIDNTTNQGIRVEATASLEISDVTITNTTNQGIQVYGTATVTDFIINGTGQTAVRPMNSGEITLLRGTVTTGTHGIYSDSSNKVTATNVDISAGEDGISARGGSTLKYIGGTITCTATTETKRRAMYAEGTATLEATNATVAQSYYGALVIGTADVTLDGVAITSSNDGIHVGTTADCSATVTVKGTDRNTTIASGAIGIYASKTSTVSTANTTVTRQAGNANALVVVNTGATFNMGAGTTIDGQKDQGLTGRGVEVAGTFNMNGGSIINNKVDTAVTVITAAGNKGEGAAVYVVGTFNMNNGTISNNTCTSNGGAIAINSASAVVILNDGTISGNEGVIGGAIICRNHQTFTMNGGSITGNTAKGSGADGGGIYMKTGLTFTMNGGSITNNTAGRTAGGLSLERGSAGNHAYLIAGTISGNTDKNGACDIGCNSSNDGSSLCHVYKTAEFTVGTTSEVDVQAYTPN